MSEDRGGYYHELFLRGRPDLKKLITRVRVKGTGCKFKSSPATEPNFYSFPFCTEEGPSCHNDAVTSDSSENDTTHPKSGHSTKKHSQNGSHLGLLISPFSTGAGSEDTQTRFGQGDHEAPSSVNSAVKLSHKEAMRVATQVANNGDSTLPSNLTVRPLPAPRVLPHFQNFQFHPIRVSVVSPEISQQLPTFSSSSGIALDKYARVVSNVEEPTSATAKERLVECPQEDDPFDARLAMMFEKPSAPNTAITLDDLVQFFVEPMLLKAGVED